MHKNVLIDTRIHDAVTEVMRSVDSFFIDVLSQCRQTNEGRVLLELLSVKQSHGLARREALRKLDRVVTELFPPIAGAPLPSEELNGKADVYLDCFLMPREKSGLASCFHDAPARLLNTVFFLKINYENTPYQYHEGQTAHYRRSR